MKPLVIAAAAALLLSCIPTTAVCEETVELKAQELTLKVPQAWKKQTPSSQLRLAQFAIEPAEGDEGATEFVVFPPFGGSLADNISRWLNTFEASGREVKITQGTAPQGKYVLVDLQGTFKGNAFDRNATTQAGYRSLNVMLMSNAGGNYFLKLSGPRKTVAEHVDAFRKSFDADESKEEPYEAN